MALEQIDAATQLKNFSAGGGTALYGSRNLRGSAESSSTTFDIRADLVLLWNPADDTTVIARDADLQNNTATAGPAANGRDQAAAFSGSSWVHFYFIWKPATSTLATLSSANEPSTGPAALPTGYTHWCYIGALRKATNLVNTIVKGGRFFYVTPIQVLTGGTATTATIVSIASQVPPNLRDAQLNINGTIASASIGTNSNLVLRYYSTAGDITVLNLYSQVADVSKAVANDNSINIDTDSFYYLWSSASGTRSANIYVLGYTVSNGAD